MDNAQSLFIYGAQSYVNVHDLCDSTNVSTNLRISYRVLLLVFANCIVNEFAQGLFVFVFILWGIMP